MTDNEKRELIDSRIKAAGNRIYRQLLDWLIEARELYQAEKYLGDGEPCDQSGMVEHVTDAYGNPVESYADTAAELLERYTGEWEATYQSGCGRQWVTVGQLWSQHVEEVLLEAACGDGIASDDWQSFATDYVLCQWAGNVQSDIELLFDVWFANAKKEREEAYGPDDAYQEGYDDGYQSGYSDAAAEGRDA